MDRFLDLQRRAIDTPDAAALLAPGRPPLTWSALRTHIETTRRALDHAGLRPGEAAALAMHGAELMTAFLSIAGQSACAPLNTSLTEEEFRFYLSHLGVRILLVQDDLAVSAAAAAQHLGIRILRVHSEAHFAAGVFSLESDGAVPIAPGRSTDAALLLYTSATTGHPKLMPLFHLSGVGAALTQLYCGGSVICAPGFDADRFVVARRPPPHLDLRCASRFTGDSASGPAPSRDLPARAAALDPNRRCAGRCRTHAVARTRPAGPGAPGLRHDGGRGNRPQCPRRAQTGLRGPHRRF